MKNSLVLENGSKRGCRRPQWLFAPGAAGRPGSTWCDPIGLLPHVGNFYAKPQTNMHHTHQKTQNAKLPRTLMCTVHFQKRNFSFPEFSESHVGWCKNKQFQCIQLLGSIIMSRISLWQNMASKVTNAFHRDFNFGSISSPNTINIYLNWLY